LLRPDLTADDLWSELPRLRPEDLCELLVHPSVNYRHILKVLERPDLPPDFMTGVIKSRWIGTLRLQTAVVNHPRTPVGDAMNLVNFLMWRELTRVSTNFQLAPEVRHHAEAVLWKRVPQMAAGEKISLARIAAGQVLKKLRFEKDPRVVKALLENPRLVEDDVLYLINQPRTPAPVLESIARDPRWGTRRDVRVALLRCSQTPLAVALGFVSSLTMQESTQLLRDPKVPLAVRKAIERRMKGR